MAPVSPLSSLSPTLRQEWPKDQAAIFALTKRAFAPMAYSDGTEPYIVDALRRDGDLRLSLVLDHQGEIIGHIAFSPVVLCHAGATQDHTHTGWMALGPVSVAPELQKQGLGRRLIEEGLAQLRAQGAAGVVLIGSPELYGRFGFESHARLTYRNTPGQYVQSLPFGKTEASGDIRFAKAFDMERH